MELMHAEKQRKEKKEFEQAKVDLVRSEEYFIMGQLHVWKKQFHLDDYAVIFALMP